MFTEEKKLDIYALERDYYFEYVKVTQRLSYQLLQKHVMELFYRKSVYFPGYKLLV